MLLSSLTELNCRPSPYHGDALPTELRELGTKVRLLRMPALVEDENLALLLTHAPIGAERVIVWIDRIITESAEGLQEIELHPRLTVISSADHVRRREAYERVLGALQAKPGSTIEVRTEYGDSITAKRGPQGGAALFDSSNNLPVSSDDRGLGIVGQLNYGHDMASHLELFHVTAARLQQRSQTDKDIIGIANAPLDQLFELASRITADEQSLNVTQDKRSTLSESMRERAEQEASITEQLEEQNSGKRKITVFALVAMVFVAIGVAVALLVNPIFGLPICVLGLLLSGFGHFKSRGDEEDYGSQAADIQLGRVNELFDTHDLSRSRRSAEQALADSRATWRGLAGNTEPSILLKDRPRIEELASHLRLISNEQVASPADTSILVGFASLLAELNRRFPAERVPLLVDDLFTSVDPQYHSVLRELLLRASHRRQVVLESADVVVTKWAAVEAVGGDALLITDHEIDVEPIIQQAVGPEANPTV